MFVYHVEYLYNSRENRATTLGVYSNIENAKKCIEFHKVSEGYREHPNNFFIHKVELDRIYWEDGYVGMEIPSWASNIEILDNETPTSYAKRLCDKHYGKNNYTKQDGSPFFEIKRYAYYVKKRYKKIDIKLDPIDRKKYKSVSDLKSVFEVQNTYDVETSDRSVLKFIGVFSSLKNANKVKSYIKKQKSFKDENYLGDRYIKNKDSDYDGWVMADWTIDDMKTGWIEGFIYAGNEAI